MQKIHEPLTIFLIGVTGDLSKKKILKAIYVLFEKNLLATPFTLIGNARSQMTLTEFKQFVKTVVQPKNQEVWDNFASCLQYVAGDAAAADTFRALNNLHAKLETDHHCGNHMWYVATLPSLYLDIVKNLKSSNLHQTQCGWTKFLIEKPFGTDLQSASQLNSELQSIFDEDQIYRIDHFLGKETVQNLLAFRFANGLFENLWSNRYIDHIQITFGETIGVAGREQFYDQTGAIRDVVQNHLLQMIAVTLMEEPASLSAADIRKTRAALLDQLSCPESNSAAAQIVLGQYDQGKVDGQMQLGYQQEAAILQNSKTETAVAMKLQIANSRWNGVPIYLRTGKRLAQNVLELSIQFKNPSNEMFKNIRLGIDPNVLTFRFAPNEGIILNLFVKKPGHGVELDEVPMSFCYRNQYQMDFIEAYERLIHDASMGDPTLFPTASGIESSWQIIDQIQKLVEGQQPDLYAAGSWGPIAFDKLIENDGRKWLEPNMLACKL